MRPELVEVVIGSRAQSGRSGLDALVEREMLKRVEGVVMDEDAVLHPADEFLDEPVRAHVLNAEPTLRR